MAPGSEIHCAQCGAGWGHVEGTTDERFYFRVIDATRPDESFDEFMARKREARKAGMYATERRLKDFYCSDICYLDHVFVAAICRRMRVDYRDVRADVRREVCSDPAVERKIIAMMGQYEEITASAAASPALRDFRERSQWNDEMPHAPVHNEQWIAEAAAAPGTPMCVNEEEHVSE